MSQVKVFYRHSESVFKIVFKTSLSQFQVFDLKFEVVCNVSLTSSNWTPPKRLYGAFKLSTFEDAFNLSLKYLELQFHTFRQELNTSGKRLQICRPSADALKTSPCARWDWKINLAKTRGFAGGTFESIAVNFVSRGATDIKSAMARVMTCTNERNGVSNRRRLDCLLNRLFRRRKNERSASLAFVMGIHR